MLSFIRKQLSATNLMVVAALIFAMAGGAYAANGGGGHHGHHGHVAKHKGKKGNKGGKRGPRGKRGPKGETGPAGEKGATGATGPAGPAGPAGKEGKQGIQGIEGKEGPEGPEGPAGMIHPGETLPSKATETGAWSYKSSAGEEGTAFLSISFTVPLAGALDENHVHYMKVGEATAECPGSAEEPEAEPGNLCVYERIATLATLEAAPEIFPAGGEPTGLGGAPGASSAGAVIVLPVSESEAAIGWGTWAVTAE